MSPMRLTAGEKEERRRKIAELRDAGYTHADIAAQLDLSITTVKAYSTPERRESDEQIRQRQRVLELAMRGMTDPEIGKQVGLSKQRVGQILASMPEALARPSVLPMHPISLPESVIEWLERSAIEHGFVRTRSGKTEGDIVQLMIALQRGDLSIVGPRRSSSH